MQLYTVKVNDTHVECSHCENRLFLVSEPSQLTKSLLAKVWGVASMVATHIACNLCGKKQSFSTQFSKLKCIEWNEIHF